jgi:hypothetical protein
MKSIKYITTVLAAASLLGGLTTSHAGGLTRAQVKAELLEAIRTGDIPATGDHGLTERELYPHRYPARVMEAGKTRQQVLEELAEAVRSGDLVANGDHDKTLRELYPSRYPALPMALGKTRQQVKDELALAIRLGDAPVNGDDGLSPFERNPQQFAAVRAEYEMGQKAQRDMEMSQNETGQRTQ